MAYEYVKQAYGVNPEVGMRVTTEDGKKSGVVVGKRSYDHYVHVRFDGVKFDVPCHPLGLIYPPEETRNG
jgi:hypothetical protein